MKILLRQRFGAVYLFVALFIAISMIIRSALLIKAAQSLDLHLLELLKTYGIGLLYDVITASYFSIPFVIYQLLVPNRIYNSRWHKPLAYIVYLGAIYLLLFDAVAEWVFWDEFSSRFNFIAVDYLVYTHEVLGNIKESYPLNSLLFAILALSVAVFLLIRRHIDTTLNAACSFRQRLQQALPFIVVPTLAIGAVDLSLAQISDNRYENELASNGIYDFFAAYRNNQLDYRTFYRTEDDDAMLQRLRTLLAKPGTEFVSDEPTDIRRKVQGRGKEHHLNVIQLTVESLSAAFLGAYGSDRGLTPNLDALAPQSLIFTNLYATGTRTIRGMEALTLSLPPTPGRSIVKRPNNEGLFSIGYLFRERGYDTRFIYGGHGYFDNMNYFFGNNGFDVIDRTNIDEDKIRFANIWGVSDEDLFDEVIKAADDSYAAGKPFYDFVMTTSNHRPFTYPEGRIDIPPHQGREGGVKYTDYAIGRLIEQARGKPWFEDTIFVIVADHCASSAGKNDLQVDRYRIPMLIYSPKHVQPGVVKRLASQIDVAPTLLGLLNFSYETKFFGHDLLHTDTDHDRALLGNYQKLGYLSDDTLTLLAPKGEVQSYSVDLQHHRQEPNAIDRRHYLDTVAYYQAASRLYEEGYSRYQR